MSEAVAFYLIMGAVVFCAAPVLWSRMQLMDAEQRDMEECGCCMHLREPRADGLERVQVRCSACLYCEYVKAEEVPVCGEGRAM